MKSNLFIVYCIYCLKNGSKSNLLQSFIYFWNFQALAFLNVFVIFFFCKTKKIINLISSLVFISLIDIYI